MKTNKASTVSLRMNRKTGKSVLRRGILAASIGALLMGSPHSADAATRTWDGFAAAGGAFGWSADNWAVAAPRPVTGDDLVFVAAANFVNSGTFTNDIAAGLLSSVNSITFNGNAGVITLNGNQLGIGAGGITNNSAQLQTISFGGTGLTLGVTQFWTANTGALTVNSNLIISAGADMKPNGAGNVVINGAVSGAGGILKSGTGNLILAGAVNLSGPGTLVAGGGTTTVNGTTSATTAVTVNNVGTVLAGSGTINSTGPVVLNGGTINFGAGATITNNLTVTGGAWNGLGSVGGNVNVQAGNLAIGAAGNMTVAGTVNVSNAATLSAAAAASTITGSLNYTSTANSTFQGVIAGGASTVTMNNGGTTTGGGSLHLTGNNTYGGVTTVTSGYLFAGNANALGGTGAGTTVASGATLAIDGGINIGAEALSIAGAGVTTGGIGVGALQFGTFGAGVSGYAGAITLTGNATMGSSFAVTANISGGINTAGNTLTFGTAAFPGFSAIFNINTIGISGGGGVVVDGHTTNLNASNTYTGSTSIINGGVLNATVAGALPAPAADGGTGTARSALIMDQSGAGSSVLNLVGFNQAVASLTGAGTSSINLNANTLTVGTTGGSTTFNGIISGAGSLIKDGTSTLVLGGQNTYGGSTTVNQGTLSLTVANALPVGTILNIGAAAGSTTTTQVLMNGNAQSVGGINFVEGQGTNPAINTGAGTLTLTGNVTLVQSTVNPGTGSSANISFGGGGFLDLAAGVRTFTIASTGNYGANGDLQIGSVIQNGGITLNAGAAGGGLANTPGTLELLGANTYAGLTTVNSGVLRAANNSALGGVGGLGTVVNAGGTLQIGGAFGGTVNVGAEALTINGVGAALGAGTLGALATNGGTQSYGGAITVASNATISANGGTLTLTGGINKNGVNLTLGGLTATNAFGTINVNSVISGAAANSDLIVESATINLNAANTYNGATFIRSSAGAGTGILNANVAGALPDPNFGAPARSAVTMDDATSLGSSVLNLNGGVGQVAASLTSPDTAIGRSAKINLNGNTLTIGNSLGGAATTFTGTITGTGPGFAIIKDGTSTQVLTGFNTYIGFTAVNGGTLQVGDGVRNGSQLGTGLVFVNPTGTLDIRLGLGSADIFANTVQTAVGSFVVGSNTAGNSQRIIGAINGAGRFTQNGGGTSVFENVNTYSGGTRITNASTIVVGTVSAGATAGQNIASPGTTIQVDTGSTLRLVNVSGGVLNNNIDNATAGVQTGTVDSNSTLVLKLTGVLSNTGAGATLQFQQNGIGTTILTGASNYTGSTTVNAGTLQIGDGATPGTTIAPSGQVLVNATGTLAVNLTNGSIFANGVNLVAANSTLNGLAEAGKTNTLGGVIIGIGVVNQNGAGTSKLSGANTYTGATNVNAGTLQAGVATLPGGLGVLPVSGAFGVLSPVTLTAASARLDLNGFSNEIGSLAGVTGTFADNTAVGAATLTTGRAGSTTFNGIIQNAGGALSLVKEGAATTFTLTGVNTYTGSTIVNAGILRVANASALGAFGAAPVVPGTSSDTVVTGGASLVIANGITVNAEALTINGAGTGAAAPGALTQDAGGTSTFTGPITLGSNSTINANGGTLTLTGGINKNALNLTLAGTAAGGTINIRTAGITGAAANSDLIVDSATVNEDVANSYNGQTFIRSSLGAGLGVLNTGVANALPTANGRSAVTMDDLGLGSSVLNIAGTALNPAGASQAIASLTGAASSSVTLGGNTLTIGTAAGTTTFAGVISSVNPAGGITKDGLSTQVFTGANTYSGVTNVNAGILNIQNNTGLGAATGVAANGTVVLAGATLQLQGGIAVGNEALTINGTGAAGQLGALVNVAGVNSFGGLLTLGSASAIESQAGTLNVTNPGTIVGGGFGLTLTGAANGSIASIIDPTTSSLTKNGAGTWTLSGVNTYTGATTVNNGTLQAGVATSAFGIGSAVNLTNAGGVSILDLNGFSNTIGSLTGVAASFVDNTAAGVATLTTGSAGSTTYNGVIRNTGGALSLTKAGAGTTFTLTNANTYSGLTTVAAGILNIQNGAALGLANGTAAAGTVVANGATLQLQGGINVGNEALTLNGTGAAGQTGALVNVNGVNNYAGLLTLGSNSTVSSNAGTLNITNAGAIVGGGNALTLAGASNGSVTSIINATVSSVTKNGAGTWTLNGANTYTGATNVNAGTLKAGVASVANVSGAFGNNSAVTLANVAGAVLDITGFNTQIGSLAGGGGAGGNVTLGAAQLTIGGNNNLSGSYAGIISGAGSVVKNGGGTQTLNGASTYTGGTTLNAGTLAAGNTKAFGSGNLTIAGGTVQTSNGPLIVNLGAGNIAANAGTALFNVGGTTPGGAVNGHDQIATTGNFTFAGNGSTIALVRQGGYLLAPGDKVNLVTAAAGVQGGTVNGTPYANVTASIASFSNTPLLIPTVNRYLTTVTLEALQGSFKALAGQLGFTPNQIAVAGALDSVAAKNLFKTGVVNELNFLDTQPLSTLPSNLDKIAPEELTSIFHLGVALANVYGNNLDRRMEDIRQQAGGGAIAAGPADAGNRFAGGAPGPRGIPSRQIAPPSNDQWGMFLTGSGEFTHVGSTTNAAGYNFTTGGLTTGIDYRVTGNLAVGLSLGYANTDASLVNGGSLTADGGRLGLYATWFDQNFHVDASVTGGLNSYKTRRVTPNNTIANGSPNGTEIDIKIGAGYDWKFGGLTVGPVVSYQYTNMRMDGFTETGAFAPLTIAGKTTESSRTSVGVRAYYDGRIGGKVFRPEVRLAWQHEAGATGSNITANFATLGGSPFTVAGTTIGRDSLLASAGFAILWNDRLSTFVYYDGQFGGKNYESHNISGGVRLQF